MVPSTSTTATCKAASHDLHVDTPVLECPQSWSPRTTPKLWRGPTEPPPPPGQFWSVRNVIICHPSWGDNRRCPSPWIPGPNMTTDPRGEPLLPDQSPFSARRLSIATRGGIIIQMDGKPPPPPPSFLCPPSWLHKRKRLIQIRAPCCCMTRLPTGKTHHSVPVSSDGSLSLLLSRKE